MTSNDEPNLDELLGLVNHPGPLPGDGEQRLLRELHASLDRGPLAPDSNLLETGDTPGDTGAELITLRPLDPPKTTPRPRSRTAWIAAAAAAVIALALGAVLLDDDPDSRVANPPPPPPVLTGMREACTRFADATPDRADLTELVATADPNAAAELTRTLDAFEILRRDLDAAAELTTDELASLEVITGFLRQATLQLDNGQPAGDTLDNAHQLLRTLGDHHQGFRGCRDY